MSFRLADYVVRNTPVQFFEEFVTGSLDTDSGVIQFDDEDGLFERPSTLVPVECMVVIPVAKRSEKVKDAAVFFEPEVDEENDDLLMPSPTLSYMLNKGAAAKLVDSVGSLKVAISVPRDYAARNIEALTRKEQSKIVAMNFNVLEELKKHDPGLVERLMNQVKKGELTTDRIDAALNLDIALNNPEFMGVITDAQMQQSNAQLALLLGCDVELLNTVYECVPMAEKMLDALKVELGLSPKVAKVPDDSPDAPLDSRLEPRVSDTVIEEIDRSASNEPITVDVTATGETGETGDEAIALESEPQGEPLINVLGEFLTEPDEAVIDETIAAEAIEASEASAEETPVQDETETTEYVDPFLDDSLAAEDEPAEEPGETDNGEVDDSVTESDTDTDDDAAEAKTNRRTATTKRRPRATRKPLGATTAAS